MKVYPFFILWVSCLALTVGNQVLAEEKGSNGGGISMSELDKKKVAEELKRAQKTGSPISQISSRFPNFSISDAYAISRINVDEKIASGSKVIGRKIGLTSFKVQEQLGVDEPDFGYLTSDMLIDGEKGLKVGSLIQGKIEGEVAFTLKKDLKGPNVSPEDVLAATDYVQTTIEIVDSRVEGWKIKIQDTIADNASSAFFVLGNKKTKLENVEDLVSLRMKLTLNGEVVSEGVGSACMGNPIIAVAWLANALSKHGDYLKKGDVVLSGAFGPMVNYKETDTCLVEIESLGSATCSGALAK